MEQFHDPENQDLRDNMGAAAHLIHGSSDGRFSITYAVKNKQHPHRSAVSAHHPLHTVHGAHHVAGINHLAAAHARLSGSVRVQVHLAGKQGGVSHPYGHCRRWGADCSGARRDYRRTERSFLVMPCVKLLRVDPQPQGRVGNKVDLFPVRHRQLLHCFHRYAGPQANVQSDLVWNRPMVSGFWTVISLSGSVTSFVCAAICFPRGSVRTSIPERW